MATKYVAAVDGVLIRVSDRIVSLYQLAPVPDGADKDHVKVLLDRGLLVDAPESDAPEEDHGSSDDQEAADKAKAEKEAADKAAADGAAKEAADKAAASKSGSK